MAKKGFNAPQKLSDELQEFLGEKTATRGEIVKAVWKHIKKKGLQNKKQRRIIEPDKTLATIIGKKPIDMFRMVKKINEHIG